MRKGLHQNDRSSRRLTDAQADPNTEIPLIDEASAVPETLAVVASTAVARSESDFVMIGTRG